MPVTVSSSVRSFVRLLDFLFFLLVSGLDNPALMQKPLLGKIILLNFA